MIDGSDHQSRERAAAAPFADTELWLVDLAGSGPALEAIDRDRAILPHECAGWEPTRKLAHVALRLLLWRYGADARAVRFETSGAGKPSLPGAPHFSLSHTASFALIGLCRAGSIGVDIELASRPIRMSGERLQRLRSAGEALAPAAARLSAGSVAAVQAFVRLEAYAKAEGSGLARLLGTFGVLGRSRSPSSPAPPFEAAFAVSDLAVPDALAGAIALPAAVPVPRVRTLPAIRAEIERLTGL